MICHECPVSEQEANINHIVNLRRGGIVTSGKRQVVSFVAGIGLSLHDIFDKRTVFANRGYRVVTFPSQFNRFQQRSTHIWFSSPETTIGWVFSNVNIGFWRIRNTPWRIDEFLIHIRQFGWFNTAFRSGLPQRVLYMRRSLDLWAAEKYRNPMMDDAAARSPYIPMEYKIPRFPHTQFLPRHGLKLTS